jgi:ABC-2 type transport system permease protein
MAPRYRYRAALAAAALAPLIALSVSGCGSTGITATPLETSLSSTFANLYILQQAESGNPRPTLRALDSHTGCLKGIPSTPQSGSGNWLCYVTYYPSGPQYPVIAKYKVDVQTDGCYAADGDGPASVNGSPTITGPHYVQLLNPLSLVDGCFNIA